MHVKSLICVFIAVFGGWVLGSYVYVWAGTLFSVGIMFYLTTLGRDDSKHIVEDQNFKTSRAVSDMGDALAETGTIIKDTLSDTASSMEWVLSIQADAINTQN
ncbi:MAG TPA: hypothetical protein PK002_14815, partial [Cellvibrio sp.]|nr:hypothetical protein [Cellvibrio sp.]